MFTLLLIYISYQLITNRSQEVIISTRNLSFHEADGERAEFPESCDLCALISTTSGEIYKRCATVCKP